MMWRVKKWYLQRLADEARRMSRAHYNIARNALSDHEAKKEGWSV